MRAPGVWAAMLLISGFVAAEDQGGTVLVRSHPAKVKWGEVTAAETSRVGVPLADKEREFPDGLALIFQGRERSEEVGDLFSGRRTATSESKTVGSVFVAGDFGSKSQGWERFKERLMKKIEELGPSSFESFLSGFKVILMEIMPSEDFTVAICSSIPEKKDRAELVFGETRNQPDGSTGRRTGSTGYSDPRPVCSALDSALRHEPPFRVVTTDFQVESAIDETLAATVIDRTSEPQGEWPRGLTMRREPAPEGTQDYQAGNRNNEKIKFEQLRHRPRTGEGKDADGYVLVAEVEPVSIPEKLLPLRSVLVRWIWSAQARQLGTGNRSLGGRSWEAFLALFPGQAAEKIAVEDFTQATARTLEKTNGLLTPAALLQAMTESDQALGYDEVLAVRCEPRSEKGFSGTLCLARACTRLANAEDFCTALAKMFPDMPGQPAGN